MKFLARRKDLFVVAETERRCWATLASTVGRAARLPELRDDQRLVRAVDDLLDHRAEAVDDEMSSNNSGAFRIPARFLRSQLTPQDTYSMLLPEQAPYTGESCRLPDFRSASSAWRPA